MSFGGRLEKLRGDAGLSRRDVAERMGVRQPTVWSWEKGRAYPSLERLPLLARVLGVPVSALLPEAEAA